MIDVVALLLLGVLLVRGWLRGFVREGMDLAGLVVGTVLAFRLCPRGGSGVGAPSGLVQGVTRTLTDPDGLAREAFTGLGGDRIVGAVLRLRELVGSRRVVIGPGERLELTAAAPEDLEDDPAAARRVFELLNEARVDGGLAPLVWSDTLAAVAAGHASEMYREGYFAHESPVTGDIGDRLPPPGGPLSGGGGKPGPAGARAEGGGGAGG